MAFQVSPGVQVKEIDLTNVVPAVSTSIGAIAGSFQWGPVEEVVQVSSEKDLVAKFGRPSSADFRSFMDAAQFLQYASDLRVVRANATGLTNASSATDSVASVTVTAPGTGYDDIPTISFTGDGTGATAEATLKVVLVSIAAAGSGYVVGDTFTLNIGAGTEATIRVTAIAVGGGVTSFEIVEAGSYSAISAALTNIALTSSAGTGLEVDITLGVDAIEVTNGGSGYTSAPTVTITQANGSGATATSSVAAAGVLVKNGDHKEVVDLTSSGNWVAKYPGELGNSIKVVTANHLSFSDASFSSFATLFDAAPVSGEIHVVVLDEDGVWTGTAGTVLETFAFVSTVSGSKKADGTNNYFVDVVNNGSEYVWHANTAADLTTAVTAIEDSLSGGTSAVADENVRVAAYSYFEDAETLDVNLIIGGAVSSANANSVIAIAEGRKDCIAFVSPEIDDTVGTSTAVANVIDWASAVTSSSYGVLDSTALYVYDKYNDVYRWVSASGSVAGLCANTDNVADAWFSPAGFERGQLRNVVKVASNPKQAERDSLYKARINPIVSFPGQGIVLFGDKTALDRPSAFDRINVRRLFITIEKAISTAARSSLFEFNDEFTRAQFLNLVEPFLRDVQGRRGITDFSVVADETNNTDQIIDSNQFVADIYIKPTRSINFITLNFVATRSGVEFSEIVGG